jgi:hypothetical protein
MWGIKGKTNSSMGKSKFTVRMKFQRLYSICLADISFVFVWFVWIIDIINKTVQVDSNIDLMIIGISEDYL